MFSSSERGAAAVEFAILLPVFVLLVFGTLEFAIAFSHYLVVVHAAREGARLASVGQYTETLVRERAAPIGYETDGSGDYLMSVSRTPTEGSEVSGEPVTVSVTYPQELRIPIFGSREVDLSAEAIMRFE